jgi:putative salt-induced outer membrane protein
MRIVFPLWVVIVWCFAGVAWAAAQWRHTAELSFVQAAGNAEATSIMAQSQFHLGWEHFGLDLEAGTLAASSNRTTTAESYFAGEKFSWGWSDKNYLFEKAKWEKDRFAGIRSRYTGSGGAGRQLMDSPRNLLAIELGAGYVLEDREADTRNDFASGVAVIDYVRVLTDTARVTQKASLTANLESTRDHRIDSETALIATISSRFSIKTSFTLKRANLPPLGYRRNDTVTAAAIIYNSFSRERAKLK